LAGQTFYGTYGSYYSGYWTVMYTQMSTQVTRQGTLGIELIDARGKDLAWRMFVSERIINNNADKIWKTADDNIIKAFKRYPPTPKAIEEKKAERAKMDAAKAPSQR
jgi:hypothetical protein